MERTGTVGRSGRRAVAAALVWTVGTASALAQSPYVIENYVKFMPGDVPVILTVPHGGAQVPAGVSERRDAPGFIRRGDDYTRELAETLAADLTPLLGGRPYVVIALFDRKYIEANRPDTYEPDNPDPFSRGLSLWNNEAYNDADAYSIYKKYHDKVREYIDDAHARFSVDGVLLDIHGQGDAPCSALRGTRDGRTARLLTNTHGEGALTGPSSIFGRLASYGYSVFPPPGAPLAAPGEGLGQGLNGGHTVSFYGSFDTSGAFNPDGIDAIQIETGRYVREGLARSKFAQALANSVAVFYDAYVDPSLVLPTLPTIVRPKDLPAHSVWDSSGGGRLGSAAVNGDFNRDGYEDVAVGRPGRAGTVRVFYGHALGALPVLTEDLSQGTVGATNEDGDAFGASLAAGDFNLDGFSDLAIGVPGENDQATDDGMVVVLYGTAQGFLDPDGALVAPFERLGQAHAGATPESGDRFGAALAVGDFNDDGRDDLAVGVPDEDDDAAGDGMVVVFYGSSAHGLLEPVNQQLQAVAYERLGQAHAGAAGESGDAFGWALAVGDFNGNGVDDLAVGVPGEDDAATDEGMVVLFYGSSAYGLLRPVNNQQQAYAYERLGQAHAGALPEAGDRFGASLAAGNFNADAADDLAVGVPNEDDAAVDDGMVVVFYGSTADGLLRPVGGQQEAVSAERVGQAHAGALSEAYDRFGSVLAVGDFNGNGVDDLVVGLPGEDDAAADDGMAIVYYGSTSYGLIRFVNNAWKAYSSERVGQKTAVAASEAGDAFASALASPDFNADGKDDLAAGAPGEDIAGKSDVGAVYILPGSPAGLY